jgi:hypothetical protein
VAYLAYRSVPLSTADGNEAPELDLAERRRRLALLCKTYGHEVRAAEVAEVAVRRLQDLAEFTAARAAAGADRVAAHVQMYLDDRHWLSEHLEDLSCGNR